MRLADTGDVNLPAVIAFVTGRHIDERFCGDACPACGPQAIAEAVQSAVAGKQQVVEPDHLAKALLEQPNGLARRIIVKARPEARVILVAARPSDKAAHTCFVVACKLASQHPMGSYALSFSPCVQIMSRLQVAAH